MGLREFKIEKNITVRDVESLKSYFAEVNKIPLLTTEQEVEYAIIASKGNREAIDMLIKSNLRFVISVAKQSIDKNCRLEDLINEGNKGLIKAAERFDHTKGFKFISFAVWYIRGSIESYKKEFGSTIRVTTGKQKEIHQLNKILDKLEQELEYRPAITDLVEYTDTSLEELKNISFYNNRSNINSLDTPIHTGDGDTSTLLDIIEDENVISPDCLLLREERADVVSRILNTLDDREREILTLFYGLDGNEQMDIKEIGVLYNLSKERIRQLKDSSIWHLKHKINKEYFKM